MYSYRINLSCDSLEFEKLQGLIFDLDPKAKIQISKQEDYLSEQDINKLKKTIERVENGTEKLYSFEEGMAILDNHISKIAKA